MRKVLAIAQIAVRSAIRSRVVLVLLAFMVVAMVGLPLTIKGDGTIHGKVQIMLGYTLSIIRVVLSIATVWAGCAAISTEIQGRQIQLVGCKPIRRGGIWLGKWIGLMAVNAFLLLCCGAGLYALTLWSLRPPRISSEDSQILHRELLVAREAVRPEPDATGDELQALVEAQLASGELPPHVRRSEVERAVLASLLRRNHSIAPGAGRSWRFSVPPPGDQPVLLRARFASSQIAPSAIPGEWQFRLGEVSHTVTMTNAPNTHFTLEIPSAFSQGGPLEVAYRNLSEDGSTAMFTPNEDLLVLVHRGGFAGNLFRSLLIVFAQLAFLAALGVTAGTLFSLPVAALFSGYALILIQSAPYIESMATRPDALMGDGSTWAGLNQLLRPLFQLMNLLVAPLRGADPLHLLAQGLLVPWASIGAEFLIRVAAYSGVAGLFAAWVFNRRELALPSE